MTVAELATLMLAGWTQEQWRKCDYARDAGGREMSPAMVTVAPAQAVQTCLLCRMAQCGVPADSDLAREMDAEVVERTGYDMCVYQDRPATTWADVVALLTAIAGG